MKTLLCICSMLCCTSLLFAQIDVQGVAEEVIRSEKNQIYQISNPGGDGSIQVRPENGTKQLGIRWQMDEANRNELYTLNFNNGSDFLGKLQFREQNGRIYLDGFFSPEDVAAYKITVYNDQSVVYEQTISNSGGPLPTDITPAVSHQVTEWEVDDLYLLYLICPACCLDVDVYEGQNGSTLIEVSNWCDMLSVGENVTGSSFVITPITESDPPCDPCDELWIEMEIQNRNEIEIEPYLEQE